MKKHNDGYVLPFVLVVLVVVCLVAVSLMSNSLSNLQRQQASIERMQAKYVAMGEIEKEIAKIEELEVKCTGTGSCTCPCASGTKCSCGVATLAEQIKDYNAGKVTIEKRSGDLTITAIYKVTIGTSCSGTTETCACKGADGTASCTCKATATVGECTSYTISTGGDS